MLEYKNVNYQEGNHSILTGINVKFAEKKITAIIGPNGSGKSSLIKLLSLNQSKYQGEIVYCDQQIKTNNLKDDIAIVLQENVFPNHLTVIEFVKLSLVAKHGIFSKLPKNWIKIVNEALDTCNCLELKNQLITSLSGGERQRVLIAAALIKNPKLLVLDEPLSYLDVKYQAIILSLLKELNQRLKITIIIVIHDINQAIHLADNLVLIKNKQIMDILDYTKINENYLEKLYDTKFIKQNNHFILKL